MKPATLAVGSTKFAANSRALTETIFDKTGTASGLYSARKHSILFSTPQGEPFACLVANPGQSKFFVSCSRQADRRVRYMFGLSDNDAQRLGISALRYSQQADEADRVWSVLNPF